MQGDYRLPGCVLVWIFAATIQLAALAEGSVRVDQGATATFSWTSNLTGVRELYIIRDGDLIFRVGKTVVIGDKFSGRLRYTGSVDAGRVAFSISDVTPTDAGRYRCGNGSLTAFIPSCEETLQVTGLPTQASVEPVNKPVVGRSHSLRCVSLSTSRPSGSISSYVWLKNNSTESSSSQTLNLPVLTRADEGTQYRCQAREGRLAGDFSPVYTLLPNFGPTGVTLSPEQDEYTVGPRNNSLPEIVCTSSRCNPSCAESWSSSGSAGTLLLRDLDRASPSTYTCTAGNAYGSSTATVRVTVQFAPVDPILSFNNDKGEGIVRVREGSQLLFTCRVDGLPRPALTFLHEGQVMEEEQDEERRSISSGVEFTRNASCEMTGMHRCHASNLYGAALSKMRHLTVDCRPRPAQGQAGEEEVDARLGEAVELTLHLLAYPQPNVTWYYRPLTPQDPQTPSSSGSEVVRGHKEFISGASTTTTLRLSSVQDSQFGVYVVEVVNVHGRQELRVYLREIVSDKLALGIGVGLVIGIFIVLSIIGVIVLVMYFRWGKQCPKLISRRESAIKRQESAGQRYENVEVETRTPSRSQSENLYENSRFSDPPGSPPGAPPANGEAVATAGGGGHYEALDRSTRIPLQETYEKLTPGGHRRQRQHQQQPDNIYVNS